MSTTGRGISFFARAWVRADAIWRTAWLDIIDWVALLFCGGRIGGGVFAGMIYPMCIRGMAASTKRVGFYEAELIPVLSWAMRAGFDRFVNIGSAEGYYAVGFARGAPETQVDAFDDDVGMHALLAENAARNAVQDRIQQHGRVDHARLRAILHRVKEPFMLVDIEGYERELLDPAHVPALTQAWLLVELHPHVFSDVAETLRTRFAKTHKGILFEEGTWKQRRKVAGQVAPIHWLAYFKAFRAERRGFQTPWLLMKPDASRRSFEPGIVACARQSR